MMQAQSPIAAHCAIDKGPPCDVWWLPWTVSIRQRALRIQINCHRPRASCRWAFSSLHTGEYCTVRWGLRTGISRMSLDSLAVQRRPDNVLLMSEIRPQASLKGSFVRDLECGTLGQSQMRYLTASAPVLDSLLTCCIAGSSRSAYNHACGQC